MHKKERPETAPEEFAAKRSLNLDLDLLGASFAVCRLAPALPVPAWAAGEEFVSITRTPDELSIVCSQNGVPEGIRAERDFRVLKIRGPLDFALVGVLSGLAGPLAEAGISIFALSTFDTDYILVKQEHLGRAAEILIREGHNILGPY
jgi:hypothetical protein